jgi:hypothetical protein
VGHPAGCAAPIWRLAALSSPQIQQRYLALLRLASPRRPVTNPPAASAAIIRFVTEGLIAALGSYHAGRLPPCTSLRVGTGQPDRHLAGGDGGEGGGMMKAKVGAVVRRS